MFLLAYDSLYWGDRFGCGVEDAINEGRGFAGGEFLGEFERFVDHYFDRRGAGTHR